MTASWTRVLLSLLWLFVFGMVMPDAVHAGYVTGIRGIDEITQRAERTHDRANRLTSVTPPTGPAQTLVYDHAGNLIRRSIGTDTIHYQWDAWNRLVEVRREDAQQNITVLSRAVYDGEHRRVIREVNTTNSGDPDERRRIYYDDAWRMIQEDVSDWNSELSEPGWDSPHTQVNWYWGFRGTNDIAQRTERDLLQSGDPITKQRWYVTDLDSSVIATVSQTGMIVERVSYSPFGEVRHHPLGDLNGDGAVDSADQALLTQNWGNAGIGDLNQDGVVDSADLTLLFTQWTNPAHPAGTLSTDGNTIGFTAHIYDVESGLLLARFRVYDAQLGRWLSPDPAGFVDGMNLYLYVRGNPLLWWDPLGLEASKLFARAIVKAWSHADQAAMGVRLGASAARIQLANVTSRMMDLAPNDSDRIKIALASGMADQVLASYEEGATAHERNRVVGGNVAESLYIGAASIISRQMGLSGLAEGLEGTDLQTGDRLACGDRVARGVLGGAQVAAWAFPAMRGALALRPVSRAPLRQAGEMVGGARQAQLREAVSFLKDDAGVMTRSQRRQIIESFGSDMRVDSFSGQAYQYSGFGGTASRYLTPTPLSNPVQQLALPPSNPGLIAQQFSITPTRVLSGTVAPQNFGAPLAGGVNQIFVPSRSVMRPTPLLP